MTEGRSLVPFERIASAIYLIRGQKVMLDFDLAALYGVETKALKRAVRRNRNRFPDDFMFVLEGEEFATLRRQFGTSKTDPRGGIQYAPMAFTAQGVAMLSSVLRSERAVAVNIAIMRAFIRLREFLASQAKLGKKLRELEQQVAAHHKSIGVLFEAITQLTSERPPAIGFQYIQAGETGPEGKGAVKESRVAYRARPRKGKKR
ncbi:MAG: ORF6N domain-containing protein [Lentisphaerae bacterium]|nr:ORF6N domain-containing protein [Lentisphaerota bacterium]